MFKIVIRRFLRLFLQMLILTFVIFLLSEAIQITLWSTDPTVDFVTDSADVFMSSIRFQGALSRYWNWLVGIRNFGMPAIEVEVINTLRLSLFALFLVYAIGIPLGIISGRHSGTWWDQAIQMVTQIGASFPSFALALLLLLYFGFDLGWFPTSGSLPPGMSQEVGFVSYYMGRLQHLILPAFSLAIVQLISPIKYLRSGIVDTEHQEFVTLARAKGASENHLFKKHIFKNSLTSMIGSFPIQLAALVSGSIFIEQIFSFPGLGNLFFLAFTWGATDLVSALVLVFGLLILFGAFISDMLLIALDPRIKIEE